MYNSDTLEMKWLGNIPSSWEMVRLGNVLQERKESNDPIKTKEILSLSVNQGVVPYAEKVGGGNKAKEDYSKYKLAYPNDIVMNSMNVLAGSVNISNYFGCVSPVYYMLFTKDEKDNIKFFNYIFQTREFQKSLFGLGNGIMIKESGTGKLNTIRMRIPMEKLTSLHLPYVDSEMQNKIVNKLDRACFEIDNIIEKSKQTIEQYETLKQSIIIKKVLKGIKEAKDYKDSGIDFIGKIPTSWRVTSAKNVLRKLKRPIMPESEVLVCSNSGKVLLRGDNPIGLISTDEKSFQGVEAGDLLIHGMDTWHGAMAISNLNGKCTGVVHVCDTDENKDYITYYLRSLAFKKVYKGIASGVRENTSDFRSWDKAGVIPLVLPSKPEQDEIAEYLNKNCNDIDLLIEKKQFLISQLESYKKAIIYEYITGKKEI